MGSFVFAGPPENWKVALTKNIWGATQAIKDVWLALRPGDTVCFYAGAPIRGVIGFGRVVKTFESDDLVWPQEFEEGRSVWKYKVQFEHIYVTPEWRNAVALPLQGWRARGVNPVRNMQAWGELVTTCEKRWSVSLDAVKAVGVASAIIASAPYQPTPIATARTMKEERAQIPKHNELRDMILELGRLEGKVAEIEYPIDNLRLDVAWKSIPTGNPKWVFEVQMAGNFYEALTKLKHAWDKWNSRPYLVTTDEYISQARSLLEGSFHEMKEDARLVNWSLIVQLYNAVKEAARLRGEIRL